MSSASYDEWVQNFIRHRVLLTLRIWFTTNSLYLLTAPFAHPEQAQTLFALHGAIFFGLLTCWALYKSQIGRRYPSLLIVGAICPITLGDAQGTGFLDKTDYCMYMTLSLLAAAILIPVRWQIHAAIQVITLLYFLSLQAALNWNATSWNTLYNQIIILVCVSGVASYSVYTHERLQRSEFNSRRELEAANAQLHQLNQELQSLASLDELTRIANRRCFDKYLEREWLRLAREQAPLSLILCDIDYFKLYNDSYGHQVGDECLQRVAQAIKSALQRSTDLVARYGGEEFVVILPHTTVDGAIHVAEKIRAAVKAMDIVHVQSSVSKYVTLSLGAACVVPECDSSPSILIVTADRALYQAKAQGRDRVISSPTHI